MGPERLKGCLMQNNRVLKMPAMPHFNSLFILMEYKSLKTGT